MTVRAIEAGLGSVQSWVFGVCIDFTSLADLDHKALTKGIRADLDFLPHVRQVNRLAMVSVVSDKQ